MSKKFKPAKSKPGKGNNKDSITDPTLSFDGLGPITSDTIYNQNSPVIRQLLEAAGGESLNPSDSWSLEVEFGSSRFIVGTFVRNTNANAMPGISTTREVLMGDFKFTRNKLASAKVDYIATVQKNQSSDYELGDIVALGGAQISDPSSIQPWMSEVFNSPNNRITSAFEAGPGFSDGDRGALASFGEGRFFQDGWWNNPFSSNHI